MKAAGRSIPTTPRAAGSALESVIPSGVPSAIPVPAPTVNPAAAVTKLPSRTPAEYSMEPWSASAPTSVASYLRLRPRSAPPTREEFVSPLKVDNVPSKSSKTSRTGTFAEDVQQMIAKEANKASTFPATSRPVGSPLSSPSTQKFGAVGHKGTSRGGSPAHFTSGADDSCSSSSTGPKDSSKEAPMLPKEEEDSLDMQPSHYAGQLARPYFAPNPIVGGASAIASTEPASYAGPSAGSYPAPKSASATGSSTPETGAEDCKEHPKATEIKKELGYYAFFEGVKVFVATGNAAQLAELALKGMEEGAKNLGSTAGQ